MSANFSAVTAANRFGLGARPGEITDIGSQARDWLVDQVSRENPVPAAIASLPSSAVVFTTYRDLLEMRRDARDQTAANETGDRGAANVRQKLAPLYLAQVAARYQVAIASKHSFHERLVHFWTNYFAVSADKVQVAALAATLENEAVRPNLAGSFADLLLAVESHPAMILYLDNQASIGPNSRLAQRANRREREGERKLGINENLAREILELHTLGVNGGYTQADVTSFARVLTGWSIGGGQGRLADGKPGVFQYRDILHEPGAQTVVGKRYAEGGVAQARAVLNDLAQHPATATHVASRLVRHFVADDPPVDAVQRVAKVFRDSEGNLPAVHRALIDLPHAWVQEPRKFKTPHEFVISAFRGIEFTPDKPQQVLAPFQLLGQRPYTPGSPAGWPDTAAQWDGPDALLKRIEWSTQLSERMRARVKPLEMAHETLGSTLSDRTRTAIARAASAAQGMTLLLVSPEFMRR